MSAHYEKNIFHRIDPRRRHRPRSHPRGRQGPRRRRPKFGFKLDYTPYDFGGDRYLRTGETLPDSAIAEFRKHQAIYLGAIGHPDVKPGILEVGILLKTRFELDQYINLRPVKLYRKEDCPLKDKEPKDVDFVVIRENTGGIYTGVGGAVQKGTTWKSPPRSWSTAAPSSTAA
jgi:isocitrate/isopropylmalate dehydrogenase